MRKNSLELTLLVVLSVCSVRCNDSKFKFNFNIVEHLKRSFYAKSDLNITNVIGGFMSQNWTENRKCLTELNAIKNGITNFDEWAITRKLMRISHKFCKRIAISGIAQKRRELKRFHIRNPASFYEKIASVWNRLVL